MSDMVTQKIVDDLRRSLSDMTTVVDDLILIVWGVVSQSDLESQHHWAAFNPRPMLCKGKELVSSSSSRSEEE